MGFPVGNCSDSGRPRISNSRPLRRVDKRPYQREIERFEHQFENERFHQQQRSLQQQLPLQHERFQRENERLRLENERLRLENERLMYLIPPVNPSLFVGPKPSAPKLEQMPSIINLQDYFDK